MAKSTTGQFFKNGLIQQTQTKSPVDHEENTSYQSLISYYPDTIYAMDLNGNILSCNSQVEGILGYTSSEIHGPFNSLAKKENLKKVINHFEQAVAGQVQNYDCIAIHKDGHFV